MGEATEPPVISTARGPPGWDDYNQEQSSDEVDEQSIPNFEFNQRASWWVFQYIHHFLTNWNFPNLWVGTFSTKNQVNVSKKNFFRFYLLFSVLFTSHLLIQNTKFSIYWLKNAVEFPILWCSESWVAIHFLGVLFIYSKENYYEAVEFWRKRLAPPHFEGSYLYTEPLRGQSVP